MSKLPEAPSALDPWLGQSGIVAHPNSPAGGGGPGRFVTPGVLGACQDNFSQLPHPQSPAARTVFFASNGNVATPTGNGDPNLHTKRKTPAHAPKTREMTVYGSFPSYWAGQSDARILKTLNRDQDPLGTRREEWNPGTKELLEFAKKGAAHGDIILSTDFYTLLYRLGIQPPKSITRLNVITHANDGWVSFSGNVLRDGVDLDGIPTNAVTGQPEVRKFDDKFMESAEDPSQVFKPGNMSVEEGYAKGVSIDNVRAAFSDDAKVVIYACHAGLDKGYLQSIAHLFGVPVQGFSEMIAYTPIPNSTRKRIVGMTYEIKGSNRPTQNFHQLIPDVEVAPQATP